MHPNEIPKPTDIEWQVVTVELPDGRVFRISRPLDAFELLDRDPATRNDDVHLIAKRCCQLALERKMSANEARLAFIAAAMGQALKAV